MVQKIIDLFIIYYSCLKKEPLFFSSNETVPSLVVSGEQVGNVKSYPDRQTTGDKKRSLKHSARVSLKAKIPKVNKSHE